MSPEAFQNISLFIQSASLVFLGIYVIKTWEMASATRKAAEATEQSVAEMRETRNRETAPYVVAYFEIPRGSALIHLVVKNIGRSVATDVHLTFKPELQTSLKFPLAEVSFIKGGMSSMPPGFEIRTIVDSTIGLFNSTDLPLQYSVRISFSGGPELGKSTLDLTLDLSAQKGAFLDDTEDVANLVSEMKTMGTQLGRIRESLAESTAIFRSGLYVKNPALSISILEPEIDTWSERLGAKLREFSFEWSKIDDESRRNGTRADALKRHMTYVAGQITLLLANRPPGLSEPYVSRVAAIGTDLANLSEMKLYMDGGASAGKFSSQADHIVGEIDRFFRFQADNNTSRGEK